MEQIEIGKVKELIVDAINKKYGDINTFLETDFGKSLGNNVKTYLYPSGAISYPVLKKLCTHLGLGELTKETIVVRTIEYSLKEKVRASRATKKVAHKVAQ